jgi:hypothetical protein
VQCYVLILPILFLIPLHLITHPHTRLLIPGTALLSSLTSLMLFLLTLLTFSPALPLNLLPFAPLCALGCILPIVSLSSTLNVLTEIPQSFGLLLEATLLMLIP